MQSGLFAGLAPYGYRNVRIDGRSLVQIDEEQAKKVRYIFDLYAHHNCTIDLIVRRLTDEQIIYTGAQPEWVQSKCPQDPPRPLVHRRDLLPRRVAPPPR